jgi:hypothetical protein
MTAAMLPTMALFFKCAVVIEIVLPFMICMAFLLNLFAAFADLPQILD